MNSSTVIRYQTTPETADENQRLIEKVFAELAATAPEGLRYTSLRLADGVTFLHLVVGEGRLLPHLAAFQEFQRELGDRLTAPPERNEATIVGSYGFS